MIKLTFRSFTAIKEPETCERYLAGHVQVLKDYGITNITTNNRQWMSLPTVHGIVAEAEDGTVVGGVRVHIADGVHPLPVEDAVGYMDPFVSKVINQYFDDGTGELCGLWNAKSVAGIGISILLVRAGIAIVNQIRLASLFTICADYTMPMVRKVGFVVEDSLGNAGEFVYPNENYIARVLRKMNAETLETAEAFDRERIFDLRNNPQQITIETGPKGDLEVDYQLVIPTYE
ncbi:hypothetical protein [Pedobacter yulinensis]|uniref:hypothetical protein n=1 Tax=Pedobacter yulinensis TaxID=2126353 RepID=UPI0013A63FD4|nr:hypothetical protein [Pedobacter yulinensis]